ncbi:MAG TPA: 3-hydroxybutyrate oligomer hydrolase family protein, partial [Rudaea sp.]|nr:3-hydroxybutyrate oligomer hydrolase family protein [Rudaea sp.]
VALAPNVHAPESRALYDYTTEAALLLPCALADARFDAVPFARIQSHIVPSWTARCASLHARGMLAGNDVRAQSAAAIDMLHARGWTDAALATAASSTAFDLWRAIGATYASSYTRNGPLSMPCGFRFAAHDAAGKPRAATPAERAAWWADASGIPPGAGVFLDENPSGDAADPTLEGLLCLRDLWTEPGKVADTLRTSVGATTAKLPRKELPIWVIHGAEDGLLPMAFTSTPYVDWLRKNERSPIFWPIAHAQHFDAFLALPAFGDRYVPLLPYGYAALDAMFAHVVRGAPLAPGETPAANARGAGALGAAMLGLDR